MRIEVFTFKTLYSDGEAAIEAKHNKRLLTFWLSKYGKRWGIRKIAVQ